MSLDDSQNISAIYITGNSRSGTTMMGRIFGLHTLVHTFHELHFFEQLWSPDDKADLNENDSVKLLCRLLNIERNGYFTKEPDSLFITESKAIIQLLPGKINSPVKLYSAFLNYETFRSGKTIACKQTPQNIFYLNEILNNFPTAKVIVLVRDPRDVLLSQRNRWKRRKFGSSAIPFKENLRSILNYNPVTISMLWKSAVSAGEKMLHDKRVIEIRYEDLLNNPEKIIRELCEFTGIEFEEKMLNVPHKGSSTEPDSMKVGIKKGNTEKWKSSEISNAELYICQTITKNQRERLGYDDQTLKKNFAVYLWKLYWPVTIALGFMFNLHRMKNIKSTLKRRFSA